MRTPEETAAHLDEVCTLITTAFNDISGDPKTVHARTSLRLAKALLANLKDEMLSSVK